MPTSHAAVILPFIDHVWNRGDLASIDRYVDSEYSVDGTVVGADWVRANVQSFRRGFPDLRIDIEQLVEDATGAALLVRLRGSHLGPWNGWEPTGRLVDYREAAFWTLADEKLVSGNFVADTLRIRIQLGIIPETMWRASHSQRGEA